MPKTAVVQYAEGALLTVMMWQSPQSPAQTRPITPLSDYLSSPVPNYAATLYNSTQAEDEADDANVSFLRDSLESLDRASDQPSLRTHIDPQRDPRRSGHIPPGPVEGNGRPTPSASQSRHQDAEDLSRRERLQRVLARLNRLHEPTAPSTSAYSNRTPSPNRQSLYDWAPSYNDNDPQDNELDAILNELRRQQPDTHPDILRVLSQSQLDGHRVQQQREENGTPAPTQTTAAEAAERRDRLRDRERRRRETEWVSLRTRAAIQRSRQEGSPSATDRMLRYVMERERSGMSEEEERARGSGWFRPSPSRGSNDEHRSSQMANGDSSWALPPPANEARDRERQERIEAFRRGYLAENVPPRLPRISTPSTPAPPASLPSSSSSPFLENALKYLDELRSCSRYEESLSTAIDHGLATKEFFADKHDDFIMDLHSMEPLQYSSWLQPGTVFDGHQHATNGGCISHNSRSSRPSANATHLVEQINPNYGSRSTSTSTAGFDHPPGSTRVAPTPSFDATRPWLSHQFTPPLHLSGSSKHASDDSNHDRWPVRVIIHSIDPERMTLQGTMEAYDVPQHPASLSILHPNACHERPKAGKKHAPITTYLEGHIIDLTTHSFLTPDPPGDTSKPKNRSPTTSLDDIAFPSATPSTDASNWHHLPPFSSLATPAEMARLLLSQARMNEINQQYIFMRWKERCFVHTKDSTCPSSQTERTGDQDRGHGLTISGFYYVSLRRDSGEVEGLYFDPTSTPYQHLRLKGGKGGWGAWEFR